jgi:hypothetical protein
MRTNPIRPQSKHRLNKDFVAMMARPEGSSFEFGDSFLKTNNDLNEFR